MILYRQSIYGTVHTMCSCGCALIFLQRYLCPSYWCFGGLAQIHGPSLATKAATSPSKAERGLPIAMNMNLISWHRQSWAPSVVQERRTTTYPSLDRERIQSWSSLNHEISTGYALMMPCPKSSSSADLNKICHCWWHRSVFLQE